MSRRRELAEFAIFLVAFLGVLFVLAVLGPPPVGRP